METHGEAEGIRLCAPAVTALEVKLLRDGAVYPFAKRVRIAQVRAHAPGSRAAPMPRWFIIASGRTC